ncbi:uncharacterized protein LOC107865492 [Capsicum annuum]|uniref:uncharacterized protein LOC107865492 n=1 Tax=Capsicum annuum TaxID=4072 RepID=UPI0007BFD092|nr:uncharacterized protein LOC107865492 [Capsicum annuum]
MSNLSKLEFVALDITEKNYLSWVLDAEIHLDAKGLGDTIKQENDASSQYKMKAMIFLRHHLHEGLKTEYLTVKYPLELWINLKDRYHHLKLTVLPKAKYDWIHLRFQDFKIVVEYNSVVHKLSSILRLCGETITYEDLLEKTFSTFHASNVFLQQQYREKGFKKYSELITCLLVAKQNNTLLMKNHEARPTVSASFLKANVVAAHDQPEIRQNYYLGRGRGHYRGRGRESGHWTRVCRMPDHFVKLYQASLKRKENDAEAHLTFRGDDDEAAPSNTYNNIEANLAYKDDDFKGLSDITHLKAENFYEDID